VTTVAPPRPATPGPAVTERGHRLAQDALAETARRYRACPRFTRHYVASKLRRDPVHREVLAMAAREPFGDVVDLGCGRGQLGVALLAAELARSVLGVDRAGSALADARQAAAGLPFATRQGNMAADPGVPACDTVLLVDVLYQLGAGPALRLLRAAAGAARERVIVRSLDPAQGWRSRLARGLERSARPWWPHAGRRVEPLPVPVLLDALREAGFTAEAAPCWQGTPFANVLIAAKRVG
jgi:SAM-dependent methyltransferase